MNEIHPAVVRCQVTCLNQQKIYNPAMALIVTSQGQSIEAHGPENISSMDGLYEIRHGDISYCDAQNDHTMEFEFLIYSNSSKIDCAKLKCGVIHSSLPCWGQIYATIRYKAELASTVPNDSNDICICNTCANSLSPQSPTKPLIFLSLIIIPVIIIVSLSFFAVGFLHMRLHKKTAVFEEQVMVMKVVDTNERESKVKQEREEEVIPVEDAYNPSPNHTKLSQKLPDTISSRDNK